MQIFYSTQFFCRFPVKAVLPVWIHFDPFGPWIYHVSITATRSSNLDTGVESTFSSSGTATKQLLAVQEKIGRGGGHL